VRAEPKSLETFPRVVKSLGTSIILIQSNIVASHRMTKRPICAWPNWVGVLNLNHSYALAWSWLLKADKMKCATHLMLLSVIGSLITCCRKSKLNYQAVMSYHHRNMHIVNGIILILMLLMIAYCQSAINEGWLKFAENPQMKLDKEPFLMNMSMVELDG
jgi:hypothetical protein